MTVTPIRPQAPPVQPETRLHLDPEPSRRTVLDGAWWPHSTVTTDELSDLLDTLPDDRGVITHAILHDGDWDLPHPRRITAGDHQLRLGWFSAQPAGLITLVCDFGRDRFDLFVVPPDASGPSARRALDAAADPADRRRAPDLLTGIERAA